MKTLLLGARGAVGAVVRQELIRAGHHVTTAGRTHDSDAVIDVHADLAPLAAQAQNHDVVVNASGVERADLVHATGSTPLVEISATGSYLEELRGVGGDNPVLLGAGLAPGASTVLVASLHSRPGDDIDVLIMLGSGEQHGPAAVEWTADLVGNDVYRPPESERIRNLVTSVRSSGPDGKTRRYLRADFPDHILLGDRDGTKIRSYLTLSSAPMTTALQVLGRVPALRRTPGRQSAPRLGRVAHRGQESTHRTTAVRTRTRPVGDHRASDGTRRDPCSPARIDRTDDHGGHRDARRPRVRRGDDRLITVLIRSTPATPDRSYE
ncbi:saccharopine dehydrogenase [Gordonia humi]|uniref:saccharopine dehydrogenase n=1 Tax=Gordonia humi TaxID=686429 RepID=UPI003615EB4F